MQPVNVTRGESPVILGLPHSGTYLPAPNRDRLNENGLLLADTDWHVDRLYEGLVDDMTVVAANFHRYVIDANRDPAGSSLYPGQNTTTLVPLTDFDGLAIWKEGAEPGEADIALRIADFHNPYHLALAAEIERIKALHGFAILYDCHSIRSVVPFLFEGTLPDFNIGTDGGRTCAPAIEKIVLNGVRQASGFTHVLNGRFKGGWTTRHYGRPSEYVHAIQMELAQSTHLATQAPPFDYDQAKADHLRITLRTILAELAAIAAPPSA